MTWRFLRALISRHRTMRTNRMLGAVLSAVAGAVNAGGFLAVQRYTSHMSGIVSAVADDLAVGQGALALAGLASLIAFLAGAMLTTILINWARRRCLHSEYAAPLLVEAALLLVFGLSGAHMTTWSALLLPSTVLLLCFIMGLQNAMVTKASQATIRTTHMTGVVTDLGIELGRLMYWNRTPESSSLEDVRADQDRLRIHLTILGCFFLGGVSGALAFKHFGFIATVPLAVVLTGMALPPVLEDLLGAVRPNRIKTDGATRPFT